MHNPMRRIPVLACCTLWLACGPNTGGDSSSSGTGSSSSGGVASSSTQGSSQGGSSAGPSSGGTSSGGSSSAERSSSAAPPSSSAPGPVSCGDGVVASPSEACDDGDTDNSDGCSSTCTVEPGFSCSGQPSRCGAAPMAGEDMLTTLEDTALTVGASALLANDTVPGGATLTVAAVGNATHGTVTLSSGTITFTPDTHFPTPEAGTATFDYTVEASTGAVATGTAFITVTAVADAPVAQAADVTGNEDTAIALDLSASLVDTDGSETLQVLLTGLPAGTVLSVGTVAGGEAALTPAQLTGLTLTPPADFHGMLMLELAATAGEIPNNVTATTTRPFTVTVANVPDQLTATDDAMAGPAQEDEPLLLAVSSLLANDRSPDGGMLSVMSVMDPVNCTATLAGPFVVVQGNTHFSGTATFTYVVGDGVQTAQATVSVLVAAAADAPTLSVSNVTGATGANVPFNVTAALVDNDGSESLSVLVRGLPDGAVLSAGTPLPPSGSGQLNPRVDFASPGGPAAVAVGRFNADARDDLAVAGDGTVRVFLGQGDGTFANPVGYAVGADARYVGIADVNNDTHQDLLVANQGSNSVSVLLGFGDGTFGTATFLPTGALPRQVGTGQFDNNGSVDLVSANFNSNTISILMGVGDGTFQPKVDLAVGTRPFWASVGRFNGDAFDDVVTANFGSGNVSVLLGNGDGTFQPRTDHPVGTSPRVVLVLRANADARDDLAVLNAGSNDVSILLGNGDGTFGAPTNVALGMGPAALAAAHMNGDTVLDLVAVNLSSRSVSVLLGNGDGTFAPRVDLATANNPSGLAVGHFNSDPFADVVVANIFQDTLSLFTGRADEPSVLLTAPQLPGLTVTLPAVPVGPVQVHVTAVATEASNGNTASRAETLSLTAAP